MLRLWVNSKKGNSACIRIATKSDPIRKSFKILAAYYVYLKMKEGHFEPYQLSFCLCYLFKIILYCKRNFFISEPVQLPIDLYSIKCMYILAMLFSLTFWNSFYHLCIYLASYWVNSNITTGVCDRSERFWPGAGELSRNLKRAVNTVHEIWI